ncbi:integrator complex subunit 13 [Cloeon dipterum]|uniref:integrator complex subunit 13 n=1 Tax=Cloeon dipterum TaxID=197152 RepID=UPI00321FEB29
MTPEKSIMENHKTVFVLDHSPFFNYGCNEPHEFEFSKSRPQPGIIPMAPIDKSLWTSCVESALEYCRVVWDIYPSGKLISFIISDYQAHRLSSWSVTQQNLAHLHNQLALIGAPQPPPTRPDHTAFHGLKSAVELLAQCSEMQHEKRTSLTENASKVQNRTRVLCMTSVRDEQQLRSYIEYFNTMVIHQNKIATGSDNLIPIHHCHLVLINVCPNGQYCEIRDHPQKDINPGLTVETISVQAGSLLSNRLSNLVLAHYNLASTTVTGIPMKEEQNAGSSANYDVEIFHPASSHQAIIAGTYDTSMIRTIKEGADYETVTLKWCTPRAAVELQHCTMMQRITPVDINSRPSLCLTNFLLSGRSVMLEMPRRSGGKVMSHLLATHGGEIFIHTLSTTRSVLEDPPSISEGTGGRVTDYRITEFGLVMKANKLMPLKRPNSDSIEESPMYQMKKRLDRFTKYWPMTISKTVIFNMRKNLDPLLTYIAEEEMTEEQLMQCQHVIYSLVGLESKHEPLSVAPMGQKGKGPKRDELYSTVWNELENFIKLNCHSENHRKVLNCLLECRNKPDFSKAKNREDKVELDQALRELEQFGGSDEGYQRASVIRATTDSPMSPPLHSQHALGPFTSLLDIWVTKVNEERRRKKPDFYGRTITPDGTIARLYQNMKQDGEEVEK